MKTCFVCETEYDPAQSPHQRCPRCLWGDPDPLSEDEPRHMVLESLIRRIPEEADKKHAAPHLGVIYRITPSAREYAVIEHGDQCKLEGVHWRVTARTNGILWVRGWVVTERGDGFLAFQSPEARSLRNGKKPPP